MHNWNNDVNLWVWRIGYLNKQEKVLTSVLYGVDKCFPPAVENLHFILPGRIVNFTNMPKMHNYLQKLKIYLCATNSSNVDSDLIKRFFRKFRSFLAPGLQVHKSRISRDKKDFWKFDTFLTIFSKSAIFNVP